MFSASSLTYIDRLPIGDDWKNPLFAPQQMPVMFRASLEIKDKDAFNLDTFLSMDVSLFSLHCRDLPSYIKGRENALLYNLRF